MIRYVVKMFRGAQIGNFALLYNDNKMLIIVFCIFAFVKIIGMSTNFLLRQNNKTQKLQNG